MVLSRTTTDSMCPVCSGREAKTGVNDLQTLRPEVINYWDYKKNKIKPSEITNQSHKKIYWECKSCNYKWIKSVYQFNGCPVCNGNIIKLGENDLFTKFPEIMKEWDIDKNCNINPYKEKKSSRKKVWWKCSSCGNEWQTKIYVRTINGSGCPKCGKKRSSYNNSKKVMNIETNQVFDSVSNAAKEYKGPVTAISNCLNGRTKTAFGYHWKYYDNINN